MDQQQQHPGPVQTTGQGAQAFQPVQQPARQPQPAPAQMPEPAAGGKKEALIPQGTAQEWASTSSPEIVLPKEVKDAGVEVQSAMPTIPQTAQQVGVQHAKEATPVQPVKAEPLGMKTPRSVLVRLKDAHKKVSSGFSWLVRLIIKEKDKKAKSPIV